MREASKFIVLPTPYATRDDFCRWFERDMKGLYLLSLLLTASQNAAEQCFASSLGDCMTSRPVFKEWVGAWARRVVLQTAIGMLGPAVSDEIEIADSDLSSLSPDLNPALGAILRLNTLERVVFVISVLEGCSNHECSLLLRCSPRKVAAAKVAALSHLATSYRAPEFLGARSHAEE
jgi:DNA-directed RNA polymerase specialized sigma24 family protein